VTGDRAYGLWPLVVRNTGLLVVFAASFFHPRTGRDWWAMRGNLNAWVQYAAATHRFVPRLRQLPPGGTPGVGDPTAPTHSRRVHPGSEV